MKNVVYMIVLLSKVLQNIIINIHIRSCIKVAILHPKKLFYLLYHLNLQYTQHSNFYFFIKTQ